MDRQVKRKRKCEELQKKTRKLNHLMFHLQSYFHGSHLVKIYEAIYEPSPRYAFETWAMSAKIRTESFGSPIQSTREGGMYNLEKFNL